MKATRIKREVHSSPGGETEAEDQYLQSGAMLEQKILSGMELMRRDISQHIRWF